MSIGSIKHRVLEKYLLGIRLKDTSGSFYTCRYPLMSMDISNFFYIYILRRDNFQHQLKLMD